MSKPTVNPTGFYKYCATNGIKSWEAARKQCQVEGSEVGVRDADLAYFETSDELEKVIGKQL